SYAADLPSTLAPIFARVDREATGAVAAGPAIDLGLYSDAARLDEFARIFAAYGSVTSRPVDGDPRVHSLVLWSRDDATALAALARAHSLGTARAAVLPTAPGRRSG
ncbi:hypothetical protein J8J27_23030, partial [Mycobacterium tuberculosis]|nr:hypothetical protein [Mycobacterium tuberculosis]